MLATCFAQALAQIARKIAPCDTRFFVLYDLSLQGITTSNFNSYRSTEMESNFLDSMTCPICFELADKAVETSCCHHVFCERCLMQVVNQGCPQCRAPFQIEVSHLSRRIIGNLPVKCSYQGCKAKVTKSEQKEHEARCQYRLYTCPAEGCLYEGLRKDFATHLAWQHEQNVVQNASLIFKPSDELAEAAKGEDRVSTRKNESGRECRLGSTGKYYCGGRLDGPR